MHITPNVSTQQLQISTASQDSLNGLDAPHPNPLDVEAIPSLANNTDPKGLCLNKAKALFTAMAQPSDDETHLLKMIEAMSDSEIFSYQHGVYTSVLHGALELMRPDVLEFLILERRTCGDIFLEELQQNQALEHLRIAMEIHTKHVHSQGHRDYDKPCISLSTAKKMIVFLLKILALKYPDCAVMEYWLQKDAAARFAPETLDFVQSQLRPKVV